MTQFLTSEALHKKSPQEITALLYESCFNNLEIAIKEINNKDFVEANFSLKKSVAVIERLGAGINYDAGIIADQLEAIYNYMADKIIEANYKKNVETVKEVLMILNELMAAWNEALKKNIDTQPKTLKKKVSAYERTAIYQ